jgi:hypothetical protein
MKLPVNYNEIHWKERRKVREEYIKIQGGKCSFCGQPLSGPTTKKIASMPIHKHLFPPKFFNYPVHLHHDHETGMTKGAVHAQCNAVLWQYYGE